jgi:Histidine kinase-, DNA gyrase B-, and HSP90-like ATPase
MAVTANIRALRATDATRIEPESSRLIHALRHLGYSFEQAVSDILDNSVGHSAHNVVVRFITDAKDLSSVVIGDDGSGMSEARLIEAMRFGSNELYDERSLGKYGLGLKLASISQAQTLLVLTRQNGVSAGRRWTIDGLSKGWLCDTIDSNGLSEAMDEVHPGIKGLVSGTIVIWEKLDRLSVGKQGIEKGLDDLTRRLHRHVGLYFHRFLEPGKVQIYTETVTSAHTRRAQVAPINPFDYPASGDSDYPQTIAVSIGDVGTLQVRACIWPPNSNDPAYKLGGKASQRQGFYFYRRDRLIQAGGWNGVVQNEAEPHLSLARAAINLPDNLESQFGLNVQKSKVVTPPSFVPSMEKAKDTAGNGWLSRYRSAANRAYRQDDRVVEDYPLVPGPGFPVDLAQLARTELTDGKRTKVRPIRIKWSALDVPDFFLLDRDEHIIFLNKNYRKAVIGERRGSEADAPIIKLLIFLLLAEDFDRDRMGKDRKRRLESINRLLCEAVRHENKP